MCQLENDELIPGKSSLKGPCPRRDKTAERTTRRKNSHYAIHLSVSCHAVSMVLLSHCRYLTLPCVEIFATPNHTVDPLDITTKCIGRNHGMVGENS